MDIVGEDARHSGDGLDGDLGDGKAKLLLNGRALA
jgi:hypothetical protein